MAATKQQRLHYWLKLSLSILLSALFLYLAVRSLGACPEQSTCVDGHCVGPGITCDDDPALCPSCFRWSAFPEQLATISLLSLLIFTLGYLLVHGTRLLRWYYLLRPLGLKKFRPALNAGAIGLAAIVIVPLRLGEFVRPYIISRDTHIPMSAALGTAVVERVIDGLSVTLILFLTLFTVTTRADAPAVVWTAGVISLAAFSSIMTVLMLCWWQRQRTIAILRTIGNKVSAKLTQKLLALLDSFLDGVASLRTGGDLYRFLFYTILYWIGNALTLTYLANAFGIELGVWEGFAVMSMLVIGIMVPGGPGHIGTFEFFLQAGLSLFVAVSLMPEKVLAFVATLHVLQFLIQVLFAIPFWLADGINLRRALAAAKTNPASEEQSS